MSNKKSSLEENEKNEEAEDNNENENNKENNNDEIEDNDGKENNENKGDNKEKESNNEKKNNEDEDNNKVKKNNNEKENNKSDENNKKDKKNKKHKKQETESESLFDESKDPFLNCIFFKKYHVERKLGEGNFSKIYQVKYKKEYFAAKFEQKNASQNLLENEFKILNYLKGPNIPNVKLYGQSGDYNILIMQQLGLSLEKYFDKLQKFTPKTTAMIGYQIISILQYIHDRHIIHRDIKPGNFLMGNEENNFFQVFIIDFGFAKKYRSNETLKQIPMSTKKDITGTARYASINALEKKELSRRDDLESLGYMMIYFLKSELPWQGIECKNKEELYLKILELKREIKSKSLCKGLAKEFKEYMEYVKNLEYEERPDYDMLKDLMNKVVCKKGEEFDYIYDWLTIKQINKIKGKDKKDAQKTDVVKSTCCLM